MNDCTLRELYTRKAEAEIAQANSVVLGADDNSVAGESFPAIVFVKGTPGPAEVSGGSVMSGPDGEAAAKAVKRLGFDPEATFAVLSRPVSGPEGDDLERRLHRILEAADPVVIIATDDAARIDLGAALMIDLEFGRPVTVAGRVVLSVDGLEASLTDESRKRRVWKQMKALVSGRTPDPGARRRT